MIPGIGFGKKGLNKVLVIAFTPSRKLINLGFFAVLAMLAACSNTPDKTSTNRPIDVIGQAFSSNNVENTGNAGQNVIPIPTISDKTKFASKDYGVSGSPRITKSKRVKKGGGSYKIGKPYWIRGKKYVPREDPNYNKTGLASWYGPNFHGRLTANGEIYDQYSLTAAHPTLPLPSYAKVTNLENGASVTVRVNDRGPYAHNRLIDLSSRAAQLLGYTKKGVAEVKVEYVGKARLDGLDEQFLVASYDPGSLNPATIPPNPGGSVLLADASNRSSKIRSRTTLQAFTDTEFVPPVPEFRPGTFDGDPVDVSSLNRVEPSGLINGFVASKNENMSFDAINRNFAELPKIAPPQTGMFNLQHLIVGPLSNKSKLAIAEHILLKWGPATISSSSDKRSWSVHSKAVQVDMKKIRKQLAAAGINEFKILN
ncbi:MAG: septal ring lytic transglycosylase RlpA family protein [Rhizobiaceae bacterium]